MINRLMVPSTWSPAELDLTPLPLFYSFVVACCVRKVWSKEFKDLDNPSSQIKRLKSILTELGMSGRMRTEQAKAIMAKRELAQESEDVMDFEKKVVGGSEGRSSRKKLVIRGRMSNLPTRTPSATAMEANLKKRPVCDFDPFNPFGGC